MFGCKSKHFLSQIHKKQYFFGINSLKSNTFKEYHIMNIKMKNSGMRSNKGNV